MEEDDEIIIAAADADAALDRQDELGRLVSAAFSFSVPPFSEMASRASTAGGRD